MAKTQDSVYGYLADAATDLSVANVPKLDYANDFAVKEQEARNVVLANTTSPLGWPETLKFSIQDIANVYANADIDPTLYAPSKKGKSVVCSVQDTAKVTNSATNESVLYPVQCHFVLKFPNTADLTTSDIMKVFKRQVALCFNGSNDNTRLEKLIHGALNPIQS